MGASQQALLAGGVGSTGGALDSYSTNLWACYGITRQRSSAVYSGSAIRVRKSTGGDTTTEQDIGFVGTALDTSALATFGGSETVVVTKLYDQSGNARDFAQATGSKQPRIVNAGTYDGFIRFDGTDDEFATTATSGTGTAMSVNGKMTARANTPTQVLYALGPGGATHALAEIYIASGITGYDSYTKNGTGTASDRQKTGFTFPHGPLCTGTIHQMGGALSSDCAELWQTSQLGTTGAGIPTGNFTAETWRLGSGGGTNYAVLNVYSWAIWEANQHSNMGAIQTAMA